MPHDLPEGDGIGRRMAIEKERELAQKLVIALAVRLRPVSTVGSRLAR